MVTSVMVVDDDPDIRTALATCLGSEGYHVEVCADGREAMDRIGKGQHPRVIVLDLMMPRMNGFDVLEALRSHGPWSRIPVVIISANRGYSSEDLGVHSVLRKPFDLQDLLTTRESIPAAN